MFKNIFLICEDAVVPYPCISGVEKESMILHLTTQLQFINNKNVKDLHLSENMAFKYLGSLFNSLLNVLF